MHPAPLLEFSSLAARLAVSRAGFPEGVRLLAVSRANYVYGLESATGAAMRLSDKHTPVTARICSVAMLLFDTSTTSLYYRHYQGEEAAGTDSPCSNLVIHSGTVHVNESRATVSGEACSTTCG